MHLQFFICSFIPTFLVFFVIILNNQKYPGGVSYYTQPNKNIKQSEEMMAENKKKNIFGKIGDAFSDRDEKEAAAAAEAAKKAAEAKRVEETEKLQKEAEARSAERARLAAEEKAKAEAEAKAKAEAEAKAKLEAEQAKQKETQERIQKEFAEKQAQRAEELKAKQEAEAAEKAKYIKHVWTNEDTYASLAFKHYGSIQEPYWRLIYDHNKAIIGDHPNRIRTGLEIEIPPLPDELKKK
jgi:hypothetical protein